jgi:hypothetical protein
MSATFASGGVHLTLVNIEVECPYCTHLFRDADDGILNSCNKNKCGYARRVCKGCKRMVGLAYSYNGIVAFELKRYLP